MNRVLPPEQRATWARERTIYDVGPASNPHAATKVIAMSPKVQQLCERIEKGVESLLEAIGEGHRLWIRGECTAVEREVLQAAAALVGRKLGKPVTP